MVSVRIFISLLVFAAYCRTDIANGQPVQDEDDLFEDNSSDQDRSRRQAGISLDADSKEAQGRVRKPLLNSITRAPTSKPLTASSSPAQPFKLNEEPKNIIDRKPSTTSDRSSSTGAGASTTEAPFLDDCNSRDPDDYPSDEASEDSQNDSFMEIMGVFREYMKDPFGYNRRGRYNDRDNDYQDRYDRRNRYKDDDGDDDMPYSGARSIAMSSNGNNGRAAGAYSDSRGRMRGFVSETRNGRTRTERFGYGHRDKYNNDDNRSGDDDDNADGN